MKGKLCRYSVIHAALAPLLAGMLGSAPVVLHAQDDGVAGPPKILVIEREFTKPGKGGAMHEKTEAGYVAAMKANHGSLHYLAVTSLTGTDRAMFLSGYGSLADWETESKGVDANAGLGAALDHAMVADGDLLSETNESVWQRRDDLSLRSAGLTGARYMEITQFSVKPGHMAEWDEMVKMYKEAMEKAVPDAHWTVFQQLYGTSNYAFLAVTPMKSLTEADREFGPDESFKTAMGADGMKKLAGLEAACIETSQTNLFHFSPKMSIPPDAWVAAEPDYWKPKAVAVKKTDATKKPADKPAE